MKTPSETMQHKEHARRQRQTAHSDELTGLPNRALLEDRLKKAIAQSKRWGKLLAVVRLRLEGLEAIRDRYGRSSQRSGVGRAGPCHEADFDQRRHPGLF